MTEAETIEALAAIGLHGQASATLSDTYRRVFAVDAIGVTQGRLTIFNGEYSHAKWYVSKGAHGPNIRSDEYIPYAWNLWLSKRELLSLVQWDAAVEQATTLARAERDEKQAWRDANPVAKRRPHLSLNTRKYIGKILFPERFV